MKYRTLGNTGLSVSEVGFGTIPILQGSVPVLPGYFNLDEDTALAVLEYAFRLGCNQLMPETVIPSFEEALSVLEKEFSPIPCDRCQRCVCPYGTEIHTLFRQYLYFFLGKEYWALRKLELGIEESAMWCRQCTDMPCLAMCPMGIRIPDEIQKILRLVRSR